MIEEEIKELAKQYIDRCTERAGFVILTENIKNDFIDLFCRRVYEMFTGIYACRLS